MQPNLPVHGCARPTVCIIKTKDTLTWDHIAMRNKMVRTVFLNRQFRNNMFSSEIGTRNKTVPNGQFWKQCVPFTDMGTRTKTVPDLPIWEQCVPLTDRNSEQNDP